MNDERKGFAGTLALPAVEEWHQAAARQPEQPLDPAQLATKLDALARRYIEESREARQLASHCKQLAAEPLAERGID